MEIKRDAYLQQLIERKDNGMIKVITGIRRCGKSFLLFTIFKRYLLENGVDVDHIIEIALDGIENEELEEQWDQIIKTNLRIPFLVTKNVVPVMIKQGKGDIVNVSSRMGRIASQMGAYAVAKGGIVTMTKTTAIQTKEYGIKCNAVSPGIVDTPGQRVYNHSVGQDGCPMGSSKDVAKAIIYLLADSPAVMTGQSIDLFTTV